MNQNTVQVNIEIVENVRKSLKVLGTSLRQASGPLQQTSGAFQQTSAAVKELEENLGKVVRKIREAAGKQKGPLQILAGQVKQIFNGLKEGAEESVFAVDFLFDQAVESFKGFQKSASAGLEDFLVVAFRNNTDKAEAQWKVFVKGIETAFLKMLAKLASAAIQENLLKPALAVAGKALAAIGIPGFAEGGVVTRPTLGVIGESGPEAIIPLAKIGGRKVLQDLFSAQSSQRPAWAPRRSRWRKAWTRGTWRHHRPPPRRRAPSPLRRRLRYSRPPCRSPDF